MAEQCAAIKKNGERCTNKVVPGTDYCFVKAHQAMAQPIEEEKTEELCGHTNLHSYDHKGKQDFITCEKQKGHEGNHGANHFEIHYGSQIRDDTNPRLVRREIEWEKEVWVEWTDDAGIPAEDIHPDPNFYEKLRRKRLAGIIEE